MSIRYRFAAHVPSQLVQDAFVGAAKILSSLATPNKYRSGDIDDRGRLGADRVDGGYQQKVKSAAEWASKNWIELVEQIVSSADPKCEQEQALAVMGQLRELRFPGTGHSNPENLQPGYVFAKLIADHGRKSRSVDYVTGRPNEKTQREQTTRDVIVRSSHLRDSLGVPPGDWSYLLNHGSRQTTTTDLNRPQVAE
jgi:hypothetical protein